MKQFNIKFPNGTFLKWDWEQRTGLDRFTDSEKEALAFDTQDEAEEELFLFNSNNDKRAKEMQGKIV